MKQIGLFYSIWHGAHIMHATGTYDNTEILKKLGSLENKQGIYPTEWKQAGGGNPYNFHWWGKPLFGYYTTADEWVLDKHVQMLTDAHVDFLVIDFTNGTFPAKAPEGIDYSYTDRLLMLFNALDKYHKQGFNVPKIMCFTYYGWTRTIKNLYEAVYKAHPEFSHLWYSWGNNGKPSIIGNYLGYDSTENTLEKEINEFFDIRDGAFPHETKNPELLPGVIDDGSILYMDFRLIPGKIVSDDVSYVCISTSEISVTNRASQQWFGDSKDRTKSWDGQKNLNREEGKEDSYLYAINFERQFREAVSQDPDIILVTGWNEWIAEMQVNKSTEYLSFIDVADINNNRDIEPMEGGYGDNYYIKLIDWAEKFKGISSVKTLSEKRMDINGSFRQWDVIELLYKDYTKDVIYRASFEGFDWSKKLENNTGRNDFDILKACYDKDNIYFYVSTVENIKGDGMTLFISTENPNGYNYRAIYSNGCIKLQGYDVFWTDKSELEYNISGNELMLKIKKHSLNLNSDIFKFEIKWADNYKENDIMSFYIDGDAAPLGRKNILVCGGNL